MPMVHGPLGQWPTTTTTDSSPSCMHRRIPDLGQKPGVPRVPLPGWTGLYGAHRALHLPITRAQQTDVVTLSHGASWFHPRPQQSMISIIGRGYSYSHARAFGAQPQEIRVRFRGSEPSNLELESARHNTKAVTGLKAGSTCAPCSPSNAARPIHSRSNCPASPARKPQ